MRQHESLPIREQFVEAVATLAKQYPAQKMGCKVFEDATLGQCVGYAERVMIAESKGDSRYRYDHYREALQFALSDRDAWQPSQPVVSVDVGCGPGLCSWAVHDEWLDRSGPYPTMLAFDRAPNMVKLADRLWKRMKTRGRFMTFRSQGKLLRVAGEVARNSLAIVSFGHVLKQTLEDGADDNPAFTGFSRILVDLSRSARACLVVVADAHGSSEVRSAHQASWEVLQRRVEARSGRLVSMGKLDGSRQYGLVEVASS